MAKKDLGRKGKAADAGKAKKPSKAGTKPKKADAKAKGSTSDGGKAGAGPVDLRSALRAGPGFVLADADPRATPGFTGDKEAGEAALAASVDSVGDLQEQLFAEAAEGGNRSVLLVIQGRDTAGKGGIVKHVVGTMSPHGVRVTSFGVPTAEEKRHPFLWRIRQALPRAGQVGVFDRSHYEDVLVVRVHKLAAASTWRARYAQINKFEAELRAAGTTVIKVLLNISPEEQGERLSERLERPDKHWKYNPGDVTERLLWSEYDDAYQAVLEKTSTEESPWFVVPADRKWYARWAVQQLLLEHLRDLNLTWPAGGFDVEAEKARLAASTGELTRQRR